MIILTEEELGEIIDLTEDMALNPGWVKEILPLAKKRMKIINRGRKRGDESVWADF